MEQLAEERPDLKDDLNGADEGARLPSATRLSPPSQTANGEADHLADDRAAER
jgi:hypothetical protein